MLTIYSKTALHPKIEEYIESEFRLNELVNIRDILEVSPEPSAYSIIVREETLLLPLDWYNISPPYLFAEEITFNKHNLLGIIYAKLNNFDNASQILKLKNPSLLKELEINRKIQMGLLVDPNELTVNYSPFEDYRLMHNNAIIRHYSIGLNDQNLEQTFYYYEEAIRSSPTEEHHAFTAKHLALLLLDLKRPDLAEDILNKIKLNDLSKSAKIELEVVLSQIWTQQLAVPYDQEKIEQIKNVLDRATTYFKNQERHIEEGLLLLDASHIANISKSFSESLGYITRAIQIFESNQESDLAASAKYRKGTLLYTWAQNGNPQFFKPAIESYQSALKTFTKENSPEIFAEIHHNLGVLYSDMPAEQKKKGIWSGIAVASFDEALTYFTKEKFPYEYGMINNNLGNAYTKFPKAKLSDNHEKALFYYQEALDIRTAEAYPYERAITLLNFLEASWDVGNDPEQFNNRRFEDMLSKAKEIPTLVSDQNLLSEAQKHLDLLDELRQVSLNS